jgi:transposase-like protein
MKLKDMNNVFKSLKHRKLSKVYCPKCASPEIGLVSSYYYMLGPRRYVCRKCGYTGPIVMELEKEES